MAAKLELTDTYAKKMFVFEMPAIYSLYITR